ncbi:MULTISPECIES: hypothetical protein [Prochlorococcus]|uniref:hypothetical protein n=1 Tax=Prochlorococcus TaxID=1218 RepID=UPI001CECE097|nr:MULTISPECIES: hypothetical protein [Prochlorococcus]
MNLSDYEPVNYLWADLLESLGIDKSNKAVRQALDLQYMTGTKETLPVLFIETCGVALITFSLLKNQTGLSFCGENHVLIFSHRKKSFQVLQELK